MESKLGMHSCQHVKSSQQSTNLNRIVEDLLKRKSELKEDEISDKITLIFDDGSTIENVNKRKLADVSPYFDAMFYRSGMEEAHSNTIKLKAVESVIFKSMLNFIDSNHLDLNVGNILSILQSSCMYQFDDITKLCTEYLIENLTYKSCLRVWYLAEINFLVGGNGLLNHAKYMSLTNASHILDEPTTMTLPLDHIRMFLSDKNLLVKESLILRFICKLLKKLDLSSDDYHNMFVECIDWTRISKEEFNQIVQLEHLETIPQLKEMLAAVSHALNECCLACIANLSVKDGTHWQCFDDRKCKYSTSKDINFKEHWLSTKRLRSSSNCPAFIAKKGHKPSTFAVYCYKDNFVKVAPIPGNVVLNLNILIGYRFCSVGRYVYIFGGEFNRIGSGVWNMDVYRLDTFSTKWEIIGTVPEPRRNFLLKLVGDCIYLVGGFGPYRVRLHSMARFVIQSQAWKTWSDITTDLPRDSTLCSSIAAKMVDGASVDDHTLCLVEYQRNGVNLFCFDHQTEVWTSKCIQISNLKNPVVFDFNLFSSSSLLFVCADHLIIYDFTSQKVSQRPRNFSNVSGATFQLTGNVLYQFNMDEFGECIESIETHDVLSGESCLKLIDNCDLTIKSFFCIQYLV